MKILIALLLLLVASVLWAASVRERWSFAWDPHPQAEQVRYFELAICLPSQCRVTHIEGGTSVSIQDVFVDPAIPGNGIAVLRACASTGYCSNNSNAVTLDRSPPPAPRQPAVIRDFIQREGNL